MPTERPFQRWSPSSNRVKSDTPIRFVAPVLRMFTSTHRRLVSVVLMMAAAVLGFICRFVPLHLPYFLYKYGGSTLWAITLYWLISAMLPGSRPTKLILLAFLVSAAVEFSRLCHTPALNAFRDTFAGKVLLGQYFSLKNIAAYWFAIVCVAFLDHRMTYRDSSPKS